MRERLVEALGVCVRIEVPDPLGHPLEAVLGTLPAGRGRPALDYAIRSGGPGAQLRLGGELVAESADLLFLVACLEVDLYRSTAELADGWVLHAAAVGDARGAVLLVGPSGAGKSTVSLALAACGLRYLTDERACIDASLAVRGLRRPLGFDAAPPLLPEGARAIGYPMALPGMRSRRLVHLPEALLEAGPLPLRLVVLLRHEPGGTGRVRPLTPGEALTRLWAESAGGRHGWTLALRVVRAARLFELVTCSVDQARTAIEALLDSAAGEAPRG